MFNWKLHVFPRRLFFNGIEKKTCTVDFLTVGAVWIRTLAQ